VDAEEVGVEYGREACLLNCHFCKDRQKLGGKVEVVVEPPEPKNKSQFSVYSADSLG
jgi:hypothetical protein